MNIQKPIVYDTNIDQEKNKPTFNSENEIERRIFNTPRVQNVLLVWLDGNLDEKQNKNHRHTITEFRRLINNVITFTESDQCITFLSEITDEKICIITSGSFAQQIVPKVHKMSQVDSIFIHCDNRKQYQRWAKSWPKIKEVSTDIAAVYETLRQAVQQCEHNAIGMTFLSKIDINDSKESIEQLDCSLMYAQITKEILLTMKFNDKHVKQFVRYCRKVFHGNEYELINLKQFKRTYREKTPILWYMSNWCLNQMLNRALRIMDMEIICKMGFFIHDLHEQIEQLHSQQFHGYQFGQILTLYHGQGLSKTDFEQIMKGKDGFISFNNFLCVSADSKAPLDYADNAVENPDLIGILFEMKIDLSKPSTPFASINQIGDNQNTSNQFLFSMYTIFHIDDIKPIDEVNRLWQVNLTLTTGNDQELSELTEHMRKETYPNSKEWARLGLLLIKMGQLEKSEQVYKIMLEQTSDDHEKAGIYHQLGWITADHGQYEEAIKFYEKSLEISQKLLPPDHPDLAMSYNNIGLVYYNMNEYSKALSSHEKALEIRQKTPSDDLSDLAMSFNNIGMVYVNMAEYSKAFPFCQQAVEIGQYSLPLDHPHLQWYRDNFNLVQKHL